MGSKESSANTRGRLKGLTLSLDKQEELRINIDNSLDQNRERLNVGRPGHLKSNKGHLRCCLLVRRIVSASRNLAVLQALRRQEKAGEP